MWLLHVTGEAELVHEAQTAAEDPDVRAVRASPRGRDVERFFKAPVWTVDAARTQATCTDLRFFSVVLGGRRPTFKYEFPLGPPRDE
jgi:hypothetical protein